MRVTKEHYFSLLLLICSIFALATSALILTFQTLPHDANELKNLNDSTINITVANVTQLETLISWQGQGTINWGLGFLASISVFFAILFTLRRMEKGSSKDSNTKTIDWFLSSLAVLFLVVSVYAVFEVFRYYRVVATLQSRWQDITKIIVPKGWQFDPIMNYWGEWGMVALFMVAVVCLSISFLKNWKTQKSKKESVTDEQVEMLKQATQKLKIEIEEFEKNLNGILKKKKES